MTQNKTDSIILERIEKALMENNKMIVATRKMYDETNNTQGKEYLAGILDTLACMNDRLQVLRKGF